MENPIAPNANLQPVSRISSLWATGVRPRAPEVVQSHAEQAVTTLLRSKWLILGAAILGGALATLAAAARPPLYLADAEIAVSPVTLATRAEAATAQEASLDAIVDGHLTKLASEANLREALGALPSDASGGTTRSSILPHVLSQLLGDAKDAVFSWGGVASRSTSRGRPQLAATANAAALAQLKNGLKISQELRSTIISIGFADHDPALAAQVANTVARVYIERLTLEARENDERALSSIAAQLPQARRELTDATDRYEAYRLTHGADEANGPDQTAQEIADVSRQLSLAKAGLLVTQTRLRQLLDPRASAAMDETSTRRTAPSTSIGSASGGDADPTGNSVGNASGATSDELSQKLAGLQEEERAYQAQIASLGQRSAELEAVAVDSVRQASGLRGLELQLSVMSQLYSSLLTQRQDLAERIDNPIPDVTIVSQAWPPTKPETQSPFLMAPPGFIFFGLLAALSSLIRRRLDRTLRGEAETADALGVPCLGLLPAAPPRQRSPQTKSAYTRALRSLLVSLSPTHPAFNLPGVILVTSSKSGEGKTALSWALARTAAELGARVLLLDLDQAEGGSPRALLKKRVQPNFNFADFANGDHDASEVAQELKGLGLWLMSAPPDSLDLFSLISKSSTAALLDKLKQTFSVVVINGPCALEGPDARLLAGCADAALFAIRWGRTQRDLARSACRLLQGEDEGRTRPCARFVGCVLTEVNLKQHVRYRFGDDGDLLRAGR